MEVKMKTIRSVIAASALAFGLVSASHADLITNGGFETGDFTGWTTNPVSFPMYIVTAPINSGSFAAQIAGFSYGPDTLSQSITTAAGQSYNLSFWRFQSAGEPVVTLEVDWNGASIFSESTSTITFNVYQQFSATVVGTGSDTLTFTSANDPGFTYLDDVSLNISTAVPEPETYAMLLAGLGFLGFMARRRKQQLSA
jgi:PEP-CTERM motif